MQDKEMEVLKKEVTELRAQVNFLLGFVNGLMQKK